eukprot:6479231-Amphidinium_carterae.2
MTQKVPPLPGEPYRTGTHYCCGPAACRPARTCESLRPCERSRASDGPTGLCVSQRNPCQLERRACARYATWVATQHTAPL